MDSKCAWSWRHAILRSGLPATTRHLLLTISCFMNEVGDGCYPTTKQLAAATGLTERAVCTHVQIAVDAGWLSVSLHGFKGQKWKNNQYRAIWPADENGSEPNPIIGRKALNDVQQLEPDQGTEGGSAALPKGTEGRSVRKCEATERDDRKALNDVQSTSPLTSSEGRALSERGSDQTPKFRKRIAYPEAFEAFWSEYPRTPNMSKAEAFDEWKKLDDDDRRACRAAIPGYVAFLKTKPDLETIHACRFIRKRRFDGFTQATAAAIGEEQWRNRLAYARHEKKWDSERWGPAPGLAGCLVPEHLKQAGDGADWKQWEQAA